ncbi:serine/threonine-protein kinase [Micromonospora sp. WMMD987]|uniref:serine/threonine-protein kinase n=1 Tax=Micromonospora sp. WMMD987 TaxID=3016089 RepID=UPI00249C114D|nr:serine/threonine-protein kinase [Micromonospora sp. WMMD987]WFE93906.1 protein kinase [Micromonospora sp. WMMD987]
MPDVTPLTTRDPRQAGPYELVGRLGSGGQGVVYLGRDDQGRWVAVKVINVDLRQHPKAKSQFAKEIAAARRVAPFCTAQILFADVDGDLPYVVSEFIEGVTLQRHVREQGPISGNALHRLAVGTATALAAIHQSDVVHCDLKPDNVILGADGPRVIDFGIARALDVTETMTDRIMGTAPYMAPERFRDDEVGPASDVFAWAGTIAFAAGGQPPFRTGPVAAVMHRVLHDPPELTGLSGPLAVLIGQCLDKDHRVRPTAQEVLLRLLGRDTHPGTAVPLQSVLRAGTDAAATQQLPRTLSTVAPVSPPVAPAAPDGPVPAAVDPWPTMSTVLPAPTDPAPPDPATAPPATAWPTPTSPATAWHGPTGTATAGPTPTSPATAWPTPTGPATAGPDPAGAATPPGGRTAVPAPDHPGRPAPAVTPSTGRDSFGRRLRRQWADPWGVSTAIFLGALGTAAGYVATTAVGTAAAVGSVTLVVVYGVRLLVAAALPPSAAPDGPPAATTGPGGPAPRTDA